MKTKHNRIYLIVAALFIFSILTSTAAFASSGFRTIEALYNDIKIFVDGRSITPTDVNGEPAEPFIVDGTTYLPIRAVSEALGYSVEWDEASNSIFVGAHPDNTAALFRSAVLDAMTIDNDDIMPLVEINRDSDMVSWNDDGQVLMLTYHRFPDSYVAGEEYTLVFGAVWTFTDREIIKWYHENKDGVTDWELRFKQLIGLPPERVYTHFSAIWVNPEDVIRPGYAWRLSDNIGSEEFTEEPGEEFKAWFDGNIIWSYFDSAFPWTRLGYTYDWSAGGSKYGLSEFLVRKDAVTQVEFTKSTDEFVVWLENQK